MIRLPSIPFPPTLALLLSLAAVSCGVGWVYDGADIARAMRERNDPRPESEWNGARIWKRVSDSPSIYIPSGYDSNASRSPSHGEWFEDDRDGKRFFVPNGGVGGIEEKILRQDALKNSSPYKARPTRVTVP